MNDRLENSMVLDAKRRHELRQKAARDGCVIYFIQAGDYIKVGLSRRSAIKGRLNTFQVSSPHPVKLLKLLHTTNPRSDERTFHKLLSKYHVRGEWFKITNAAIRELIGAI